jgi:hypothetical protein
VGGTRAEGKGHSRKAPDPSTEEPQSTPDQMLGSFPGALGRLGGGSDVGGLFLFGGFRAADGAEAGEQGIEAGVELVERFQEGDADDGACHDVAGEAFEGVVDLFAKGEVFGVEGAEFREVREVQGEAGDVEVGGHAAGVGGDSGDGLLAEGAAFIAHLGQGLAVFRCQADGAVAKGGADGVQRSGEGGDFGGGEIQAYEVLWHNN